MNEGKIVRTVTVALAGAAMGAGVNLALAVLLVSSQNAGMTLGLPALSSLNIYLAQAAIPAAAIAGAVGGAVFSGRAVGRGGFFVAVAMTLVTYVVVVPLALELGIAFELAAHPDTCDQFFRICGTGLYDEGWFLAPLFLALGLPFIVPIFGGAVIWRWLMRVVFGRPEPRPWDLAAGPVWPAPPPVGIAWAGPTVEQAASFYPAADPTAYPTAYPAADPTAYPTAYPAADPSAYPTAYPAADPSASLAEDATPLEIRLFGIVLASMIGLVSAVAIKIGLSVDSPGIIGPIDRFVLGAVIATGVIGGVLAVEAVTSRAFFRKVIQIWFVSYVANIAVAVIFSIIDVAVVAPGGRSDCFSGPCGVHRVNDMVGVLLLAPVVAFWMLPVAATLLVPAALWVWLMRLSFRRPIDSPSEQPPPQPR